MDDYHILQGIYTVKIFNWLHFGTSGWTTEQEISGHRKALPLVSGVTFHWMLHLIDLKMSPQTQHESKGKITFALSLTSESLDLNLNLSTILLLHERLYRLMKCIWWMRSRRRQYSHPTRNTPSKLWLEYSKLLSGPRSELSLSPSHTSVE